MSVACFVFSHTSSIGERFRSTTEISWMSNVFKGYYTQCAADLPRLSCCSRLKNARAVQLRILLAVLRFFRDQEDTIVLSHHDASGETESNERSRRIFNA